MTPVEFPQQNAVMGEFQPEYLPLPAHRTPDGEVTSCWRMTWRERLATLFTGRIYVTSLTFLTPLQPLRVGVLPPPQ